MNRRVGYDFVIQTLATALVIVTVASVVGCRPKVTRETSSTSRTGLLVVNPQFQYAGEFSEGLGRVQIGDDKTGKWGFIDKQGNMAISPQFDFAGDFADGLAAVQIGNDKTGKWGFIDKQGRFAVNPQFGWSNGFSEGLAAVWVAPAHVREIQDYLSSGTRLSSIVMRWLRYAYQPITALERFIYSWLALENAAGTKNITNTCPKCSADVNERSATNWECASEILAAYRSEPDKQKCAKDIKAWNRTLRNPTLHGGKATDGTIRGSMTSAQEQFRPAVEQYLRSTIGFKHAIALSKPNDGLHQIWIKNFVEYEADPEAVFPDPPDAKVIADVMTTGVLPEGVELLKFQNSEEW